MGSKHLYQLIARGALRLDTPFAGSINLHPILAWAVALSALDPPQIRLREGTSPGSARPAARGGLAIISVGAAADRRAAGARRGNAQCDCHSLRLADFCAKPVSCLVQSSSRHGSESPRHWLDPMPLRSGAAGTATVSSL